MLKKSIKWLWFPFALTLFFGVLLVLLNHFIHPSNIWNENNLTKGIPFYFCENLNLNQLIRQPVNTFTNLPFLFFGLLITIMGKKDDNVKHERLFGIEPLYSYIFGGTLILVFIGSSLFHASLLIEAEYLDLSGVYALALFPLFYIINRIFTLWNLKLNKYTPRNLFYKSITLMYSTWLILTLLTFYINQHIIVPIIILLTGITFSFIEIKRPDQTNKLWAAIAAITLFFGISFFAIDLYKVYCFSEYWLQPHSLWHILAAISLFSFYLYMRSETILK